MAALDVWMNGEHVGRWTHARGEDRFEYAAEWLESELRRPLSLSMPLRPPSQPYLTAVVRPFFDNLLPDSDELRRRMMSRFDAASTSAFDLLEQVGRDCVGAVQLLPPGSPRPEARRIEGRRVRDAAIAELLSRVRAPALGAQEEDDDFRLSLAGAQEKTALLRHAGQWWVPHGATPSTHIFKLPILADDAFAPDLSASVENEWLCAQLLPRLGVPCASCEMKTFAGQKVLVVERFDRALAPDGRWVIRRPQEDLCQATGTPPAKKYESQGGPGIIAIMNLLHGSARAQEDRTDFFRAQVAFWLLCAIDGHAKNFSLFIEPQGRFVSTPKYDVLSAYPFLGKSQRHLSPHRVKLAMAVHGRNRHYRWKEVRVQHWLETGRRCGLPNSGRDVVTELLEAVPKAVEQTAAALPRGFPESVAGPIFSGLAKASKEAKSALSSRR